MKYTWKIRVKLDAARFSPRHKKRGNDVMLISCQRRVHTMSGITRAKGTVRV